MVSLLALLSSLRSYRMRMVQSLKKTPESHLSQTLLCLDEHQFRQELWTLFNEVEQFSEGEMIGLVSRLSRWHRERRLPTIEWM